MHVVLTSKVGWEEVDYICCDPQLGGFKCSLMSITVNIFVITPCIYLPDFDPYYFVCFHLCKNLCVYPPDFYPRYY